MKNDSSSHKDLELALIVNNENKSSMKDEMRVVQHQISAHLLNFIIYFLNATLLSCFFHRTKELFANMWFYTLHNSRRMIRKHLSRETILCNIKNDSAVVA